MAEEPCRLCAASARKLGAYAHEPERVFWHCGGCDCVFVQASALPSREQEQQRYRQHRNERNPGYEAFLNRLANPLARLVPRGTPGIDFGCGPVPVLGEMLAERGYPMCGYDPLFFPDAALLKRTYSLVTCSETVEHFHQPRQGFQTLDRLLAPGGWLGVMTQMPSDWAGFFQWHYPRDPTHVVFYSAKTMQWIAGHFGWVLESLQGSVVIFQKRAEPCS